MRKTQRLASNQKLSRIKKYPIKMQTQVSQILSLKTPSNNCPPSKEESRKETAQPSDLSPSKGLDYTKIAAIFTAIAAFAVSVQVWAIFRSERAWLLVSAVIPHNIQEVRGNAVRFGLACKWTIKNYGKTPAFITKVGGRLHKVGSFDELPPNPVIDGISDLFQPTDNFPYGLSIGPGETIERYTFSTDKGPATPEDHQAIWDEKVIWIAYGIVEYRLVFNRIVFKGKKRETRFCYTWMGGRDNESFLRSTKPRNYTKAT